MTDTHTTSDYTLDDAEIVVKGKKAGRDITITIPKADVKIRRHDSYADTEIWSHWSPRLYKTGEKFTLEADLRFDLKTDAVYHIAVKDNIEHSATVNVDRFDSTSIDNARKRAKAPEHAVEQRAYTPEGRKVTFTWMT